MPGITTPYEGRGALPWRDDAVIPAPLRLHETTVCQDWVDYNGHMSESAYLLVFGDSSDAFFRFFGVDGKRLHILHEMYGAGAELVATAEQLLVHADTRSGRSAPFPELIAGRLAQVRAAHAALPVPGYVGHVITIGSR